MLNDLRKLLRGYQENLQVPAFSELKTNYQPARFVPSPLSLISNTLSF